MHISPGEYWLYLQYMALAVAMVFVFAAVYLHCTPSAELRLIRREGNVACALSFGGALIGFCLALAASIRLSVSPPDFVLWGVIAAVIQILVYFVATRFVKDAGGELARNNVAVGAILGAVSVSIGLLNAACLS